MTLAAATRMRVLTAMIPIGLVTGCTDDRTTIVQSDHGHAGDGSGSGDSSCDTSGAAIVFAAALTARRPPICT